MTVVHGFRDGAEGGPQHFFSLSAVIDLLPLSGRRLDRLKCLKKQLTQTTSPHANVCDLKWLIAARSTGADKDMHVNP